MKKKLLLIAMACVISLSTAATAQMIVTTATGSGADGGVSNDTNQRSTVVLNGTTAPIRHYDGTRAKAMILRFDVRGVGGDISGATLSFTTTSTANRGRTLNIWALTDDTLDIWNEAGICYRTAPAMLATGPLDNGYDGYDNAIITPDPAKWIVKGTIPIASAPTLNTGPFDPNIIKEDKNGLLTLLLYTSTSDSSQSWYVGTKEGTTPPPPTLTFPNARCAINPVPAIGASALPSQSMISWTNAEPNHPSGVITCDVYFGTTEPNLPDEYKLTKIASGITANSVAIPAEMLPLAETRYYCIVDTYDSSTAVPFLGTGAVWYFDVTAVPVITADPEDQTVALGDTAQFSVTVDSYSTPHFTWYHSADNANDTPADDTQVGTDAATLSLVTVGTDEGYYFCKVVNNSGEANAAYSNTGLLIVQRQVAHWTLDQADFVGGLYLDSSGEGHNADPNGDPTASFVPGVIAGSDALNMNPASFASAGTWSPGYLSNQLTISMWVKWNGTNDSYQNLLSKMDSWAADDMMWQFGLSTNGTVNLIRSGGANISNGVPVVGQWEFLAVTWDGTNATVYRVVDGNIFFSTVAGAFSLGTDTAATVWLASNAFNGVIDDIQVFNYAKDPIALAGLYNEMLPRDFCVLAYGSAQFDLDVNDNCRVDLADFADLAGDWMLCGTYPATACP